MGTAHPSIEAAFADDEFDYCVVSSATGDHAAATCRRWPRRDSAAPCWSRSRSRRDRGNSPLGRTFERIGIGYNLRFHPAVRWLEQQLSGETAIVVDVAAQSYLPEWRPGRDHRETASAGRARGGGVLRDLSHEIDLMLGLFGEPREILALGGNLGGLGIDAETAVSAALELERAPVATLRLSYLDRMPERRVRVTTALETFEADLLSGECRMSTGEELHPVEWPRTYADLHLAMLGCGPGAVCTLEEGLRVVACIEALESAIGDRSGALG